MGPLAGYRGRAQRSIAIGVVAVSVLGLSAAGAAAAAKTASTQAHAAAKTATSILHTTVPAKGKYLLIVWVRSRGKHSRLVEVYLPGQKARSVVANPWWGAAVYYTLNLSPTKLAVRTVNAPPAVAVRATLTLRKAAAPSSPPAASTTSNGAPPASSTTTSSGGSTTTTTPVTTTPPPNTVDTSAYTKNVFTDDFQTDYNGQANQLPNSQYWGLDNWGGCGGGTLSQSNTNQGTGANLDGINPDQNAYLTSQGLAITAIRTASGNYVSAQIDSAGHPVSNQYGEVEASIEMPAAQGLCPGFWMLGDGNLGGSSSPGEIDVVEAPTFGGGLGSPAYFDLHGVNTTQVYSTSTTAVNLSSGFHTYAIIWTPTSIIWTIDGVEYASATQAALTVGASWANDFDTSNFHLILDLAVGGWPCDAGPCGPQSAPVGQSYTMYVQWVKWLQIP